LSNIAEDQAIYTFVPIKVTLTGSALFGTDAAKMSP